MDTMRSLSRKPIPAGAGRLLGEWKSSRDSTKPRASNITKAVRSSSVDAESNCISSLI